MKNLIFEEMINGLNSLFYPQAEEKGLKFNTVIEGMTEELYIGDSLRFASDFIKYFI